MISIIKNIPTRIPMPFPYKLGLVVVEVVVEALLRKLKGDVIVH